MARKCLPILFSLSVSAVLCSCVWEENVSNPDYISIDDSLYPYADLSRLVIETNDFQQITDKAVKHPGFFQIYGKESPTSDVLKLTIKGRGFSSFEMTKFSYKIEFDEKQNLLGMPENRDWDLVSNFKDKSFLRNAITYQLAQTLNAPYSPRFDFVELYVNREYKGVYFLVEHVKVAKNRVNIPKDGSAFLVEKTSEKDVSIKENGTKGNYIDEKGTYFFSTQAGNIFKVEYPKEPTDSTLNLIRERFSQFEKFMQASGFVDQPLDSLEQWIDVNDFIRYYWIQEFTKNVDGAFDRSIFLTWENGKPIQMGPVWDFDSSYGIGNDKKMSPSDFYARSQRWFKMLFQNKAFKQEANDYWKQNSGTFLAVNDSVTVLQKLITQAMKNDAKRWPILNNNEDWPFVDSYQNYDAAVDSLKNWISQRVKWISDNL